MNNLIQKLIEYQNEKNLSDKELADLLRVNPSTISYWKSGKKKPGVNGITSILKRIPELYLSVMTYIAN